MMLLVFLPSGDTSEMMELPSVASFRRCPTSPESVNHFSGIRIEIVAHEMRILDSMKKNGGESPAPVGAQATEDDGAPF
jgi:hypothetical protein